MDLSYQHLKPGQSGWQTLIFEAGGGVTNSLDVFECVGQSPGPSVLVTAGVHGDEYEGPAAIAEMASWLSPPSLRGTVCMIPVANAFAFAAGTRTSPMDGINLARVFPGNKDGAPTERLAHFLFDEFASKGQYVIDLHNGGVEYEFLPVAGFYGRASVENPAFRAASAMGLPALWQLPETSGVLSREAARAGKVAIGAEYLVSAGKVCRHTQEACGVVWNSGRRWTHRICLRCRRQEHSPTTGCLPRPLACFTREGTWVTG